MRRSMLASLAVLVMLTGCARFTELSFRVDERLQFTAPPNRVLVTVPFRLSWTMRDFDVVPPSSGPTSRKANRSSGYFAVFIDRAPIGPGQTVDVIAERDRACNTTPGCPDARYLTDRGIYTTSKTSVEITRINALSGNDVEQLHILYVVLLDATGRRIGETSYRTEIKYRQKATAQ